MKKSILFFACLALVLCSCSSTKNVSYTEFTTVDTQPRLCAIPLVADLNVIGPRIAYSETVYVDFGKMNDFEIKNLIKELKDAALAHAIKAHKADVLASPQVSIESKAKSQLVVNVIGYPAVYKNFRSATPEDGWFIPEAAPVVKEEEAPLFGKKLKK